MTKPRGGNGPGSRTSSWPSLTHSTSWMLFFPCPWFQPPPQLFEGRSHTHTHPCLSLFLANTHTHTLLPTFLYSWPTHTHTPAFLYSWPTHTHTHMHTHLPFFIPVHHTHTHTHLPTFLYSWPLHTHTPTFLYSWPSHTHTPTFLYSWPSVLFPLLKLAINLTLRQPDSLMIPWYSDNCQAEQHQSGL